LHTRDAGNNLVATEASLSVPGGVIQALVKVRILTNVVRYMDEVTYSPASIRQHLLSWKTFLEAYKNLEEADAELEQSVQRVCVVGFMIRLL
jgi:hypothetical protein